MVNMGDNSVWLYLTCATLNTTFDENAWNGKIYFFNLIYKNKYSNVHLLSYFENTLKINNKNYSKNIKEEDI